MIAGNQVESELTSPLVSVDLFRVENAVYAAQEAAAATGGYEEAHCIELVSSETLETLWSHTLDMAEIGMSIASVYIKNQTDQSVSSVRFG